jgi:transcriptional regulator with XRE-family HTH domain
MALRLRIKEIAEARGISMAALGRRANVGATTLKRMYWNSSTGKIGDEPLENVNLPALERIASVLSVSAPDLLEGPMQEDRLRTLLDLAGRVAEKRRREPLVIAKKGDKWAVTEGHSRGSSIEFSAEQIEYDNIEAALIAYITSQ